MALIDIAAFTDAVGRLDEGLARWRREPNDAQLRDGLIQRFEFTYELAHKSLRRYLAAVAPSPEAVEQLTFSDLIRLGAAQGLIQGEWPDWRGYRDMRAKTSHTYRESVAADVAAAIPAFLAEAIHLRDQLRGRLA